MKIGTRFLRDVKGNINVHPFLKGNFFSGKSASDRHSIFKTFDHKNYPL